MACRFLRQGVMFLGALALMAELGAFAVRRHGKNRQSLSPRNSERTLKGRRAFSLSAESPELSFLSSEELAGWGGTYHEYYDGDSDSLGELTLLNGFPEGEVIKISAESPIHGMNVNLYDGIKNGNIIYHCSLRLNQKIVVQNSFTNGAWQGEQRVPFERTDLQKIILLLKRVKGGFTTYIFTLSASDPPQWTSLKLDFEDRLPVESVARFAVGGAIHVRLEHTEKIEFGEEKGEEGAPEEGTGEKPEEIPEEETGEKPEEIPQEETGEKPEEIPQEEIPQEETGEMPEEIPEEETEKLNPENDCFEYHTSYVGNEIENTTAEHPEECQHACRGNFDCFFFTFAYEDRRCSLKTNKGRETVHHGVPQMLVSGPRYCSGWSEDHTSYSMPTNLARPNNEPVPVSQSSVSNEGIPERAVDGNKDSDYFNKSCTHSSSDTTEKAWLEATLPAPTMVEAVTLYNRGDGCASALGEWACASRLSRFQVIVDGEQCWEQIPVLKTGAPTELFCNRPFGGDDCENSAH